MNTHPSGIQSSAPRALHHFVHSSPPSISVKKNPTLLVFHSEYRIFWPLLWCAGGFCAPGIRVRYRRNSAEECNYGGEARLQEQRHQNDGLGDENGVGIDGGDRHSRGRRAEDGGLRVEVGKAVGMHEWITRCTSNGNCMRRKRIPGDRWFMGRLKRNARHSVAPFSRTLAKQEAADSEESSKPEKVKPTMQSLLSFNGKNYPA